jgi:sec-independent protein translocase protein TatB
MFGMGMGEIIVILIVALLFLGPEKLPEAAKTIAKGMRSLRKHTQDLQETVEQDETIGGAVRELKSALRDVDPPRKPLPRPQPAKGQIAAKPAAPAAPLASAETKPETPPETPAPPPETPKDG